MDWLKQLILDEDEKARQEEDLAKLSEPVLPDYGPDAPVPEDAPERIEGKEYPGLFGTDLFSYKEPDVIPHEVDQEAIDKVQEEYKLEKMRTKEQRSADWQDFLNKAKKFIDPDETYLEQSVVDRPIPYRPSREPIPEAEQFVPEFGLRGEIPEDKLSPEPSLTTDEEFAYDEAAPMTEREPASLLDKYVEKPKEKDAVEDLLKDISKPVMDESEIKKDLKEGPSDLELAKAKRDRWQSMAMMARASHRIGAAIAGAEFDENFAKEFMELANQPVEDYWRKQKEQDMILAREIKQYGLDTIKKKSDPNSPASRMYKHILKQKLGYDIPNIDNYSAADLEKMFPTLVNMYTNEEAQKYKAILEATKAANKQTEKDQKQRVADEKSLTDFTDRITGIRRGGVFRKLYEGVGEVNKLERRLDNAISGRTRITKADAADMSGVWSRLLTGGVPSQTLTEMTMHDTAYGRFGNLKNFIMSKPSADYYTPEILKHMRKQLDIAKGGIYWGIGDALVRTIQPRVGQFKRNPDFKKEVELSLEPYIDFTGDRPVNKWQKVGDKYKKVGKQGGVTKIRRKSDGAVRLVPVSAAGKFLQDPQNRYEEVE